MLNYSIFTSKDGDISQIKFNNLSEAKTRFSKIKSALNESNYDYKGCAIIAVENDKYFKIEERYGFTNSYWNLILEDYKLKPIILEEIDIDLSNPVIQTQELEEIKSLEDDFKIDNTLKVENTGLANLLIEEVNGEWDTIASYNNASLLAEELGRFDIVNVLKDIIEEEHKHVGQLQEILKGLSPETNQILQGEIEAKKQIADIVDESPIKEYEDETDLNKLVKDKTSYFKFDNVNNKIVINLEEAHAFINQVGQIYQMLDYTFENNLKTWSFTNDVNTYNVELNDGFKTKVEIFKNSDGFKVYDANTGEPITPSQLNDMSGTPMDTEFKTEISEFDVSKQADDLDYINNF